MASSKIKFWDVQEPNNEIGFGFYPNIDHGWRVPNSGRHFASASDLLALTVALARILALKR